MSRGRPPSSPPSSQFSDGDEPAPLDLQLSRFLNTTAGLRWLSVTLDTWEQRLLSAKNGGSLAPPSMQDLNTLVLSKFKDFTKSDMGRRLTAQLEQEMTTGTFMVPVYVIEELLKHRLRALVRLHVQQNKLFYFAFFSWRVALASSCLHLLRMLLLRASKRLGEAWERAARFCADVLFPPALYGPALGILVGLLQLTNRGLEETGPLATKSSKAGGDAVFLTE